MNDQRELPVAAAHLRNPDLQIPVFVEPPVGPGKSGTLFDLLVWDGQDVDVHKLPSGLQPRASRQWHSFAQSRNGCLEFVFSGHRCAGFVGLVLGDVLDELRHKPGGDVSKEMWNASRLRASAGWRPGLSWPDR